MTYLHWYSNRTVFGISDLNSGLVRLSPRYTVMVMVGKPKLNSTSNNEACFAFFIFLQNCKELFYLAWLYLTTKCACLCNDLNYILVVDALINNNVGMFNMDRSLYTARSLTDSVVCLCRGSFFCKSLMINLLPKQYYLHLIWQKIELVWTLCHCQW